MPSTCPFCSPNVSKSCFAKSANFLAVYNTSPILPGHTLVIPKKHISQFMKVEDNLMHEMILFSRQIITTLTKVFNTSSFNWTLQEGVEAGQTIEHMHIHILPRQKKDLPNPGDWYPALMNSESAIIDSLVRPKLTENQMKSIVEHLKKTHLNL